MYDTFTPSSGCKMNYTVARQSFRRRGIQSKPDSPFSRWCLQKTKKNIIFICTIETFLAVCAVSSTADLVSALLFATLVTCALVMASGCRPSVIMRDKNCSAQAAVRTQTRNMITSRHVAVRLLWPLTGLHLGTQWAFLQRGQHWALVDERLTSVRLSSSSTIPIAVTRRFALLKKLTMLQYSFNSANLIQDLFSDIYIYCAVYSHQQAPKRIKN